MGKPREDRLGGQGRFLPPCPPNLLSLIPDMAPTALVRQYLEEFVF